MKINKSKNKMLKFIIGLIFITVFSSITSCRNYLDEKPMKYLKVPKTIDDLKALLNIQTLYNLNSALPEALADNYYLSETVWASSSELNGKMLYIWDKDSQSEITWNTFYEYMVYYPNVVLEKVAEFKEIESNSANYDIVKGEALYYRAFGFYQLSQLYCQPYSSSSKSDLGIPLRTSAAIENPSVRSTVQQTYDQIISDLITALELLPTKSINPTKPDKPVVYGLLARCYLSMREYTLAGKYADLCLQERGTLIDYNSIHSDLIPFKRFNEEIVSYSNCGNTISNIHSPKARIDTLLYESYDPADLRKKVFFKEMTGTNAGSYEFQGCYDSEYYQNAILNGITTAEMYLTRAECYARDNKKELALEDLNILMKNRWDDTVPYPEIKASNAEEALEKILIERRKELVYRGLRWSDLRRFNLEGRNITLERNVNGQKFTLPPGDPRWVMLIPDNAINRSTMKQNSRD